jgi:hypothetical protein
VVPAEPPLSALADSAVAGVSPLDDASELEASAPLEDSLEPLPDSWPSALVEDSVEPLLDSWPSALVEDSPEPLPASWPSALVEESLEGLPVFS